MTLSQNERTLTHQAAQDLIEREVASRGWTFNDAVLSDGETKDLSSNFSTVFTEIRDGDGKIVEDGLGKGFGHQSLLSARYEAFEHAVSNRSTKLARPSWYGSISDAEKNGWQIIGGTDFFPTWPPTEYLRSMPASWLTMTKLGSNETHLYPAIQADPFHIENAEKDETLVHEIEKTHRFVRYNSGSAIGASEDEATLHALLELVERYGIACFFAATYLRKQRAQIRVVRPTSLPSGLQEVLKNLETIYECSICVIDVTNEFEIPTFVAVARGTKFPLPPRGSGSSLNPVYAIERAVLEVQQLLDVDRYSEYGPRNAADAADVKEKLREWPVLLDAVSFDMPDLLIQFVDVDLQDVPARGIGEQIDFILQIFAREKVDVYRAVVYRSPVTSITAVHLVIPEFSHFELIAEGIPVVPQRRILKRLL